MKSILEIYKYTFKYKGVALLVILFNLLYVIFNLISLALFVPFLQIIFAEEREVVLEPIRREGLISFFKYYADLFDYQMYKLVEADPKQALFFACFSIGIAFFGKTLFRYCAIWFQSQLRMSVVRDIRNKLFEKAMRLPISYYTDERKGDLISRMQSDVGEIEIAVISMLELFFREPIAVAINLAVLIYWSPSLTLFSFVLLPFVALIIVLIGKSLKRTAKQGQEQMGTLYSAMDEGLNGIRIIKAFNAIPQVIKSFRHENLKHQKLITKAFRKRDLSSPLNELLVTIVMLVIVWYGGILVLDASSSSSLTGPQFLGFILIFSQLTRPISNTAKSIANMNKSSASQDRINEILNADEKIYEAKNPISLSELTEGIEYKNIFFSYKDENVLKDISFKIPAGKTVALVGESGSGKSTLADLLPRFYDIKQGEINFDGVNIKEASITDLRMHIGIVSQESILFNTTVKENIAFGMPHATNKEIENAAKIANAHNFISELESGYDTNIGERGNKLSGGQKQRISIARAILKNPSILILDEATSALDTESEKLVQEAIEKLMENRTSLVIAHRLSTIKKADNIIVLSKGTIQEQGTHNELMAKKGIYHKLSSLQGIND
ncbi:MAG: ABC transporter ATP-binding protein/permease [Crocinitomicaceae bacterium]|nr:ABC transporter ATP-binding protein/permease [Crocinitomicaceae bacterium]